MNKIAILTDSASNINEDAAKGIFVVPLYVSFREASKKDLLEITPEELYEKMEKEEPTTSAPAIDDIVEKIESARKRGFEKIIAVGASQTLSGTYNAMRLALESQNIEYRLIDSKSITMGEGLLAMYGHHLIEKGVDFHEVAERLEEKKGDVRVFATVSDLTYLIRGGRLNAVKGLIGGTLRVNPILTLNEKGAIDKCKSVVGKKRALSFIAEKAKEDLQNQEHYFLAVAYAKDKEDTKRIKEKLFDTIEKADLYLEGPITAVLGTHAGPSAYVVSYLSF